MDSVFLNGGIIGATMDYASTEQYIIGTTPGLATLVYVGGYTLGRTGLTTSLTQPFTLTGGVGGIAQNDVIVAVVGTGSTVDRTATIFPLQGNDGNPYTNIYTSFVADTTDTNIFVGYKIMGATPDTGFTLPAGSGSTADGLAVVIQVWRNVDLANPLDATPTTINQVNTGLPNPPSITTVTDGAIIIAAAANGHTAATRTFSSSELSNFRTASGSDTYDTTAGMGSYLQTTAGTFNPAQFTFSTTDSTAYSASAVTLALRPATADVTLYGNYKNSGIWNLQAVFDSLYVSVFNAEAGLTLTDTLPVGQTSTAYGTVNTVFAATLTFPVSPSDGLIWETGGTGQGAWLGIRDSGATLRLRGGDGAASKTASTTDTAVLEITDFPKDGQTHTIVWDFAMSTGTVRIFIDGILKGTASATGGTFDSSQWSGSDLGAFLQNTSSGIATGESSIASNFTNVGTGLRVYTSQLVL